MLRDDHMPALQITIHTTNSNDLPAVLHALNTHHLTTDFTADDTHPLTDLQPGHTYVTRADADTAEQLATVLATTAPNSAFHLSNDPAETQDGTYIAYHPEAGLFRAQCNADGTPLVPAEEIAHALAQVPADMLTRTWLALHAPALLGTHIRAALTRTHPQHAFRHTDPTPEHGQAARCGACGTDIVWYFDDPDAGTPYGHWFDLEDRDLCPATDVDADDPGHTPAPSPADFHQAALYLPPDPAARDESFPITAFAGLRIGAYLDDTYTLNVGILADNAHPVLRTTPDGHLAVELRVGSRSLHTSAPGHSKNSPAHADVLAEVKELVDYNWSKERADFNQQDASGQANHIFHILTRLRAHLDTQDHTTPRPGTRFHTGHQRTIPADRWNVEKASDTTLDDDGHLATTVYTLDALSADDAERRILAWFSQDRRNDLYRATATATRPSQTGRYTVYLTQPVRS